MPENFTRKLQLLSLGFHEVTGLFQFLSPQRTQSSQRCWDGERGGRLRATTNTGLSRQSLRDHDAAALRHGLSRCATRRRITAASTLRVCRATRARMPSSRHTKTPASQATRIPRQKCREHINHILAEKRRGASDTSWRSQLSRIFRNPCWRG